MFNPKKSTLINNGQAHTKGHRHQRGSKLIQDQRGLDQENH